jgi:hypothetical protein
MKFWERGALQKGLFCDKHVVKFLGTNLIAAEIHMWAMNGV